MDEIGNPPSVQIAAVRLVRCQKTQCFFTGDGWTADPTKAKAFVDEFEAARTCVEHGLENVELVLRLPGGQTDLFTTPIR